MAAVDGDPIFDIVALSHVQTVVKDGVVYKRDGMAVETQPRRTSGPKQVCAMTDRSGQASDSGTGLTICGAQESLMTDAQIQAKATIAAALIQSRTVDAETLGSLNRDISNHKLAHLRDLTERIYAALASESSG
jgi:hypothetical protein